MMVVKTLVKTSGKTGRARRSRCEAASRGDCTTNPEIGQSRSGRESGTV